VGEFESRADALKVRPGWTGEALGHRDPPRELVGARAGPSEVRRVRPRAPPTAGQGFAGAVPRGGSHGRRAPESRSQMAKRKRAGGAGRRPGASSTEAEPANDRCHGRPAQPPTLAHPRLAQPSTGVGGTPQHDTAIPGRGQVRQGSGSTTFDRQSTTGPGGIRRVGSIPLVVLAVLLGFAVSARPDRARIRGGGGGQSGSRHLSSAMATQER
jgi:hypothetical protein